MKVRALPMPGGVGAAVVALTALTLATPPCAAADALTSRAAAPPPRTVGEVEQRLADLGYLPQSAVDEVWGERSRSATIAFQKWQRLVRDGIPGPITQQALATARRPRPVAQGPDRRIEILLDRQLLLLIRNGRVARTLHVSTGRGRFATPPGKYEILRKQRKSWSFQYKVWLPWASYFVRGVAIHQSKSVPTTRASHGCVRVTLHDGRWLYLRAPVGMRVTVVKRSV